MTQLDAPSPLRTPQEKSISSRTVLQYFLLGKKKKKRHTLYQNSHYVDHEVGTWKKSMS